MLRNYFCDKDAAAERTPTDWQLRLYWPDDADRYVDAQLSKGLSWWGDSVAMLTMVKAMKRRGRILETLFDTWTLFSWSQWLARNNETVSPVILHVDDHRDLGSPRLFDHSGAFHDAITEEAFHIDRPESVQAGILSGAVGMGSFMTPFLHHRPNSEIRHLCQPPKAPVTLDFRFSPVIEMDTLLNPHMGRPAIKLSPLVDDVGLAGPACLRITPNPHDWLQNLMEPKDSRPILLHIDMDYFNNRYDGDSDWTQRENRLDPSCQDVLLRIDAVCDAILNAGIGGRIEDVVIAYSPGFFPAELWAPASDRLQSRLARIVGQ